MCWVVQEQAFLHRGVSEETLLLGLCKQLPVQHSTGLLCAQGTVSPSSMEQAGGVPTVPPCTITASHLSSPDALRLLNKSHRCGLMHNETCDLHTQGTWHVSS